MKEKHFSPLNHLQCWSVYSGLGAHCESKQTKSCSNLPNIDLWPKMMLHAHFLSIIITIAFVDIVSSSANSHASSSSSGGPSSSPTVWRLRYHDSPGLKKEFWVRPDPEPSRNVSLSSSRTSSSQVGRSSGIGTTGKSWKGTHHSSSSSSTTTTRFHEDGEQPSASECTDRYYLPSDVCDRRVREWRATREVQERRLGVDDLLIKLEREKVRGNAHHNHHHHEEEGDEFGEFDVHEDEGEEPR